MRRATDFSTPPVLGCRAKEKRVIVTPHVHNVPFLLDREQVAAWLLASGDTTLLAEGPAPAVPPMAVVLGTVRHVATPLLELAEPQIAAQGPTTLLHGDEAIDWYQPLHAGVPYRIGGCIHGQARSQAGVVLRILVEVHDAAGAPVAKTLSSVFFARDRPSEPVARHAALVAPENACIHRWRVSQDQPEQYAAASFDRNPLHLSDARAQALGLRMRPLHGMCSLAFAARSLAKSHGPYEGRLTQLRARFRKPVYPGDELTCISTVHGPGKVRFGVYNPEGGEVLARGAAHFVR